MRKQGLPLLAAQASRAISLSLSTTMSSEVFKQAALPSSFRSVYRILLRACSTAVLHQPRATGRLRRLYRPVFDVAALKLRTHKAEEDATKRAEIERWFSIWNKRSTCTRTGRLSTLTHTVDSGRDLGIVAHLQQIERTASSVNEEYLEANGLRGTQAMAN